MHPQEVAFYEKKETIHKSGVIKNVRCASSDRTLHAHLPGTPEFLLKVPLANVLHDDVYRPIDVNEAHGSIAMTEFLMQWADSHKVRNDAFCFLPEPMAIVDKEGNSSAIVRLTTAYPPPPKGKETWNVQAYSLYAPDSDFRDEAPLAIRMIENRPDAKQDELDYFEKKILKPLVQSTLRVSVDLGSSHVPHGQNLFLEIGEDGQPTGRAPHGDLESFWPHPELARSGSGPTSTGAMATRMPRANSNPRCGTPTACTSSRRCSARCSRLSPSTIPNEAKRSLTGLSPYSRASSKSVRQSSKRIRTAVRCECSIDS